MEPLISIIVLVYNVEKYLPKCIKSILLQTYKNLEVILVDDGSQDNGGGICDEFAKKDDRVIVLHQNNGGLSAARNAGLSFFQGEFVMFVDGDDYIDIDAVQHLYDTMIDKESDMAIGNAVRVDENGDLVGGIYVQVNDECKSEEMVLTELGGSNSIPCYMWGKLYKRQVVEHMRFPDLKCGEDVWALAEIVEKCNRVALSSKVVYYYVQRLTSIVHTMDDRKTMDSIHASLHVAKKLVEREKYEAAKCYYTSAIFQSMNLRDIRPARKAIKGAFPFFRRGRVIRHDAHTLVRWIALHVSAARCVIRSRKGKL